MSREKSLIALLIISAFLLTGSFAFAEVPNQLYIKGPIPNQFPLGTTKYIRATVQLGFVGVEGAEVVFTKQSGSFSFTAGVVSPDGTQSVLITNSSSIAIMSFIGECAGPGLVEVTVTGTELSAFSIFDITEAISSDMLKDPYLIYNGTNTEMDVLWQLDSTRCSSTIEWGLDTSYDLGSAVTSEYGSDHQYKYTITSLTPGSKYYYQVKESSSVTHTGSFLAAPPASASQVKLLVYGDTRTNPLDHDKVCAAIIDTYTADPDYQSLLLHVGDWTEYDDEAGWTNEFFGLANVKTVMSQIPLNGCRGNHENRDDAVNYTKYWPYQYVSDYYWSFDYGPAHIAVVDQYVPYEPGSAQYIWLENDLASSNAEWKFLLFHEPAWSGSSRSSEITVRENIQPLCLAYGVDMVFAGHNHFYARASVGGVQHITTGGGGAPLDEIDLSYPELVSSAETFHFCEIDIQGRALNLISRNIDGSVIDSFTLYHSIYDDGIYNLIDLGRLGSHWLDTDCIGPAWCDETDLDESGDVGIDDVVLLAEGWLLDFALKGHWKFDGDTTDSSMYGNDGTAYGGTSWGSGIIGGNIELDGIDGYVEMDVTNYKGVYGLSSRTLSAWVHTDTSGSILSWGDNNDAGNKWFFRLNDSGLLRIEVNGGYKTGSTNLFGGWHHVAAVLRNVALPNVDQVELYVDGYEEPYYSSVSSQSIHTASGFNVMIGAARYSGSLITPFEGKIDDVMIYDRPLSSSELAQMAGSDGLLAHWELDDDPYSLTASDISGFGYEGTLRNMDPNNWVAGHVGAGAVEFDGIDNYIEAIGFKGPIDTRSRTTSAWIRTETSGSILTWGDVSADGAKWFLRVNDSGLLRIEVQGGYKEGSTDLRDGGWHHVAAVLEDDGSPNVGEVKLYVDGQLETTSNVGNQAIDTTYGDDVTIGAGQYGGILRTPFTGQMDDVRIYSLALTEAEIQVLAGMGD